MSFLQFAARLKATMLLQTTTICTCEICGYSLNKVNDPELLVVPPAVPSGDLVESLSEHFSQNLAADYICDGCKRWVNPDPGGAKSNSNKDEVQTSQECTQQKRVFGFLEQVNFG